MADLTIQKDSSSNYAEMEIKLRVNKVPGRMLMLDHLGQEGSGIQFDDSGLDNLSGIDQEDNSMLSSNQSQPGILTLALNELFESVRQREIDENKVYIIRCSYFEIYND